ncbi:hypothetical protein ACQ4M3_08035 [Leptolyngbya sp. AN03gr2]|uniref:hypothetical protein n=1 Tax=unclassified Leptolyngbya TaxID=2650499 RepID=UPI003D31BA11
MNTQTFNSAIFDRALIKHTMHQIEALQKPPRKFNIHFQLDPYLETTPICGESYQAWIDQTLPWTKELVAIEFHEDKTISYNANDDALGALNFGPEMTVLKRTLPVGESLKCISEMDDGRTYYGFVNFDRPVGIPLLFNPNTGTPWMSLTPSEICTCRRGIELASGRVLIGGLGLGWMVREIARKPEVTEIVVVEKDPGVATMIGELTVRDCLKPIQIINDDLWIYLTSTKEEFDYYSFDIWLKQSDSRHDSRCKKARKKLKGQEKTVWAWGDRLPLQKL